MPASEVMRLPWNSSFRRRSKSTRRQSSSDSPAGCSMNSPPYTAQDADIYGRFRRFVQAKCRLSGKSGLTPPTHDGETHLRLRILPLLGRKALDEVTQDDVAA